MAERRLQLLHKRLRNDDVLRLKYKDVVERYIEKGHTRKIPLEEIKGKEIVFGIFHITLWLMYRRPIS